MKYIISEEELRKLGSVIYNICYDRYRSREVKIEIDDFLKSKQPVELVAEGEVMVNPDYSSVMVGQTVIADTGMTMELFNKFQELDDNNIKIYIRKVKE